MMDERVYWKHGDHCWVGCDDRSDEALSPKSQDPYCSWSLERRLLDDLTAVPSECGGRWVRLVEVTE